MTNDKGILIRNIYYMLLYAYNLVDDAAEEYVGEEEFDDIKNLFAMILSRGINKLLKNGLHKEYLETNDSLSVMHGKVDISGTIKNRIALRRKLSCDFDELTEDNTVNRILKATSNLLIRDSEVDDSLRHSLKKSMMFFEHVNMINLSAVEWNSIQYRHINKLYRVLIAICRFIFENLLLTDESNEKLASFVDEKGLNRLYEKFILEYYRKEHPELTANDSWISWDFDNISEKKTSLLPAMHTDISLSKGNTILIIDAKYYGKTMQEQFGRKTVHSNNLYQIYAYVKNKESELQEVQHTVSGMLLYARTEEEQQPDFKHSIGGNIFEITTLDLNRQFDEIKCTLDEIAERYFSNASPHLETASS